MRFSFLSSQDVKPQMPFQLEEKHSAIKKNMYFPLLELEKAFGRILRYVVWRCLTKLGLDVEEWLVGFVQPMYGNAQSQIRINDFFSDNSLVQVRLCQSSIVSPLLLIIVHYIWCVTRFSTMCTIQKHEKHPWMSVTFSTKSTFTPSRVFFTFFKLCE